uniref:hypothetical protein n=1 Tax=Cephaleuros parasiticus TaxID=173370 RepID=UPI001EDE9923|nr:hypothetical protein MFQ79_pgp062 [Cephaleuros parasiticus]UIB39000.1 hypothetical protein [Cephaleuros parasiticus]
MKTFLKNDNPVMCFSYFFSNFKIVGKLPGEAIYIIYTKGAARADFKIVGKLPSEAIYKIYTKGAARADFKIVGKLPGVAIYIIYTKGAQYKKKGPKIYKGSAEALR